MDSCCPGDWSGPGDSPWAGPAAACLRCRRTTTTAGVEHTCALRSDGTARCWSHNTFGQLGDGTTKERHTPAAVSGLTSAVAIATGNVHTCAVLSDGSARCWGQNTYGQLGDGTTTWRFSPVVVGLDTDGDGCPANYEAYGAPESRPGFTCPTSQPCYSDSAWYDFYDVPVPANQDPTPNGARNKAINVQDVVGILNYVGTYEDGPPNGRGVDYDSTKDGDWNGDTSIDGLDKVGRRYDRQPSALPNPPWEAGQPDGAVNLQDLVLIFKQVGLDCRPP